MASRIIIDGEDGTLEVGREGDSVTFVMMDEQKLFRLPVKIGPADARALAGYLQEVSFIAFDAEMLDVGDEDELG